MKTLAVTAASVGAALVLLSASPGARSLAVRPFETSFAAKLSAVDGRLAGKAGGDAAPERAPASETAEHAAALSTADLTQVVNTYCVVCHNPALNTGNLSLAGFDVAQVAANAPTGERMIRKLRAGMMPPPGMPRPGPDTLLALVETLETSIDRAAKDVDPGVHRFSRLSRVEYERVINDLLGLEVEAGRWLPPDVLLGSFDNRAAAQALSTTLLGSYVRAATEISRIAVGNADAPSVTSKYTAPIEVSQHAWDHLEGTPFGTRGGIVVTHDFPADGDYVLEVTTLFGKGTSGQNLDFSIDGVGVTQLALEANGDATLPIRTKPITVKAGQHKIAVAFVKTIEGPYEDRLSPFNWSFVGGEDSQAWANYGITGLPHVSDLMVTGPLRATGVSQTASRQKIFTCTPSAPSQARACAQSIVTRLGTEAYRRPLPPDDLAELMGFYDRAAATDGFEVGVRTALQAILTSPDFLFRIEREPEGAKPGENFRLSDMELASRLSFLLWATAPDAQLIDLAQRGRLSDDKVLEQQVRRMLADPRSFALASRFAAQWLRLQDVKKTQPEPFFYPDFTRQLGDAMVEETELFFDHLVREDRPLLELYNADYTYLNERLANHYGIDGVTGDDFRLVKYPNDQRRGILGHGSVLLLTSMSARTSPVLRGKWVMEVLMGTPPPPPPPNVPAFDQTPPTASGQRLTTRQRMERHRANPTCNACHRFMDPIGLALDNFDVVGRWRIRENMMPLDTRGDFYDGTPVSTPAQLTAAILKRPTPLVRNFTSNLLGYAVGRPAEYYDQPTVRAIVRDAEKNGYRMSSFILGVVKSEPFRMRRPQAASGEKGR